MEKTTKLTFAKFGEHFINFPNAGQAIEIQAMKQALTRGRYGDMSRSNLKSDFDTLDIVDAISTFSTLIPELSKKLGSSYMELDLFIAKDIVKTYNKQFLPWYNNIMGDLNKLGEENAGE